MNVAGFSPSGFAETGEAYPFKDESASTNRTDEAIGMIANERDDAMGIMKRSGTSKTIAIAKPPAKY